MSDRLPLIDLPIGQHTRGLGVLEVLKESTKIALPLSAVDIKAKVANRVASVTVSQTFKNSYSEHLEAVYIFPLSGGCAVSHFEMRVGDRVIVGKVEERAEARRQYAQALQDGKRTALLEQERDDVFTVQVGNLPPGEEVSIQLTYSERLPFFEDGKTEIRLPLVVAPRYIPGVALDRESVGKGMEPDTNQVPDASRITPPRLAEGLNPNISLNVAVEILQEDESGAESIDDLSCSQHATKLGLGNGGVQVSLAKEDERLNRDFVLQWRIASEKMKSTMLVYKDKDGSHYAMLSLLPPKRQGYLGAPRDVLFMVDRSGSMNGVKMTSAARSCSLLLSTLGPQDRFAILAFDDQQEWLLPAGQSSRVPDFFVDADEAGLERGYKYLRNIEARGGTELNLALRYALEAINARSVTDGRVPVLVILTDGEVGDESQILQRVQNDLGDTRLFTVGIDTAVNSGLLKRCAGLGGGTATFVVPGVALEEAMTTVGRDIGCPLITELKIESTDGKVENDSLAPERVPDLFAGRAVTAFFKLSQKGSLKVTGTHADGKPFSTVVKPKVVELPAIAQLWARTHVMDLEDRFRVRPQQQQSLRQRIIEIACRHSLLTRFTAFVVVDEAEIVNKTGKVRSVVQPVEQPAEWQSQDTNLPSRYASSLMGQTVRQRQSTPPPGGLPTGSGFTLGGTAWGSPPAGAPTPASSPSAYQQPIAQDGWSDQDAQFQAGQPAPAPTTPFGGSSGSYGSGVRSQVFEVVVRQALSGVPWWEVCSGPMQSNNITEDEVLEEVNRRLQLQGKPPMEKPPVGPPGPPNFRSPSLGSGVGSMPQSATPKPIPGLKEVEDKLKEFGEILNKCHAEVLGGKLPDQNMIDDLERARKALMKAMANSTIGSVLPDLQKFLRTGAVELVSSVKTKGVTAAGLQPIWERHMLSFRAAETDATSQLKGYSTSSGGKFWETTI